MAARSAKGSDSHDVFASSAASMAALTSVALALENLAMASACEEGLGWVRTEESLICFYVRKVSNLANWQIGTPLFPQSRQEFEVVHGFSMFLGQQQGLHGLAIPCYNVSTVRHTVSFDKLSSGIVTGTSNIGLI